GSARNVAQCKQIARSQNYFQVRLSAGVLERDDFVVEFLPLRAEYFCACNDHIDFVGAGFDRAANFGNAIFERRKTRRKTGGNGSDLDIGALYGALRGFDEEVIDTNRGDLQVQLLDAKLLDEFVLQRLARFGAKAADSFVGIVPGERGE